MRCIRLSRHNVDHRHTLLLDICLTKQHIRCLQLTGQPPEKSSMLPLFSQQKSQAGVLMRLSHMVALQMPVRHDGKRCLNIKTYGLVSPATSLTMLFVMPYPSTSWGASLWPPRAPRKSGAITRNPAFSKGPVCGESSCNPQFISLRTPQLNLHALLASSKASPQAAELFMHKNRGLLYRLITCFCHMLALFGNPWRSTTGLAPAAP